MAKDSRKARLFLDGKDSYQAEYDRWKLQPGVKGLVGIYELSEDQFHRSAAERLAIIGKGHYSVIYYESAYDNSTDMLPDETTAAVGKVPGHGCATGVRDQYGKVRPIIFLKAARTVVVDAAETELAAKVLPAVQLLTLIHELGHAEDIVRQVNFDNSGQRVDLIAAEVYAHDFVCRQAKRNNYRLAMQEYLQAIEDGLNSTSEVVRLSSERFIETFDMAALKIAASPMDFGNVGRMKALLKKAGRLDEFVN